LRTGITDPGYSVARRSAIVGGLGEAACLRASRWIFLTFFAALAPQRVMQAFQPAPSAGFALDFPHLLRGSCAPGSLIPATAPPAMRRL